MTTQFLSVNEFLKSESETAEGIEAVVTADPANEKNVTITPYTGGEPVYGAGISIPKESIRGVQKPGQESSCCRKTHNVVTVFFEEDAVIPLNAFVKFLKGVNAQGSLTNYPEGTMFPLKPDLLGKLPCRKAESNGWITVYRDPFGRICGMKFDKPVLPFNNFKDLFELLHGTVGADTRPIDLSYLGGARPDTR